MQYIQYFDSPLGRLTMSSDGESLTGLWFEEQKYYGSTLEEKWEEKELPIFREARDWLCVYFQGKDPGNFPRLSMAGSVFRRMVWDILKEIPYGQVVTYGDIARKIAEKTGVSHMSAQAVGGAVGHNPIGIIVPCHRVVGKDGSLTGYAGGINRKEALLKLEKSIFYAV